jgi:uncharacterized membrane protein YqiK
MTAEVVQSITQMYVTAKQASKNGASKTVVQSIQKQAEKLVSSMAAIGATTVSSSDTGNSSNSSSDDE